MSSHQMKYVAVSNILQEMIVKSPSPLITLCTGRTNFCLVLVVDFMKTRRNCKGLSIFVSIHCICCSLGMLETTHSESVGGKFICYKPLRMQISLPAQFINVNLTIKILLGGWCRCVSNVGITHICKFALCPLKKTRSLLM